MSDALTLICEAVLLLNILVLYRRIHVTKEEVKNLQGRYKAAVMTVDSMVERFQLRIENLEKGVVPDYEKAKQAADAVNEFSSGLAGILGYDPVAAYRKANNIE